MTPQEILDGTLARVASHATAWRAAAKHIHDKPAHERKPGDQQAIVQLKALALQAEQIIAWANKQQELIAADPLGPAVRSYGGEGVQIGDHATQVNNFTGSVEGTLFQAGDIRGDVNL